jgi:hypothetical protein
MEVVVATDVPIKKQDETGSAVSLRPGGTLMQRILRHEAPDGLNFSVNRIQFLSGDKAYRSARHHHGFQQIRFAESGSINYAPGQFIPEGDIAYFPRGTYYGPQLKDQGVGITVQLGFGGEKQSGKSWDPTEALELMRARGRFEDDVYIDTDPATGEERRRDAVDVIYQVRYERKTNQKFVIAPEGYETPILMHPKAFAYYQAGPGVEMKHLGSFFDHPGPNADVRISMVRLSDGGAHHLTPERAQIAWTMSAGLQVGESVYPELTCVYSPRGEDTVMSGEDGIEVFVVELPRLD